VTQFLRTVRCRQVATGAVADYDISCPKPLRQPNMPAEPQPDTPNRPVEPLGPDNLPLDEPPDERRRRGNEPQERIVSVPDDVDS